MNENNFVSIRNPERKTLIQLTSINNKRSGDQSGFSLFEFIIVIAIFSFLVSILIPKFDSVRDDARSANVQLTANSLQAAVNLTHRLWQSHGSINKRTLLKGYGNENVIMSSKGWPVGAIFKDDKSSLKKNIRSSIGVDDCKNLWRGLLKENAPKVNWRIDSSSVYLAEFDQGICRYQYLLDDAKLRIEYDLATGRVIPFF